MYLYKDCSDIPIFNFDIIYRTNDFKYLVVGYNGYKDIKVPKGANERWQEIKKEWIKLLDNNVIAYYHQLLLECVYLETRYNVVEMLLKQIFERQMDDETLGKYKESLLEWKYKWNEKQDKYQNLKRLLNQLKSSKNKIDLKIDELKTLREENELEGEATSLERQAVVLEQVTGKNNIDIKTISAKKWLEISKMASEINEQRRKVNGK
tara:strand:+ start:9742 stop:10365 length:624 start_codon:yes stop_codon:yes gene_type:complete